MTTIEQIELSLRELAIQLEIERMIAPFSLEDKKAIEEAHRVLKTSFPLYILK